MVTFTIPQEIERFLEYTEKSKLEKKILDCGAGGSRPKIAVFSDRGYDAYGVEISDTQIVRAQQYAKENKLNYKILKADMRDLPYENESFSFVYSYHTIMHLTKAGIKKAIDEMVRVLKKNGLLYINFQSTDSTEMNEGNDIGDNEILVITEAGKYGFEDTFHSYYNKDEADKLFEGMEMVYKDISIFKYTYKNTEGQSVTIDYILKKIK